MLKNLLLHFKTLADYIAKRDDTKNYGIPSDSITFVDESRRINTFNTDYYCGTSQLGSMAYKSSLYDLTIQGNGTTIGTFDPNGEAKTINITPEILGALSNDDGKAIAKAIAEAVARAQEAYSYTDNLRNQFDAHTHPYLPLTGGEVNGNVTVAGGVSVMGDIDANGNLHTYGTVSVESGSSDDILMADGSFQSLQAIKDTISAIPKFRTMVVNVLPSDEEAKSESAIYLVKSGSDTQNLYTEYIWINGAWEQLGTQKVNLDGYLNTGNTFLGIYEDTENEIDLEIISDGSAFASTRLPIASSTGAGLMSTTDKTKLNGIEAGANKYVLPAASASAIGGVKVNNTVNSSPIVNVPSTLEQGLDRTYHIQKSSVNDALVVTVPWENTTYGTATHNSAGLMSAADKTKLDSALTEHQKLYIFTVKVNGVELEVYKPNAMAGEIDLTPEILGALSNDDGKAIAKAIADAVARAQEAYSYTDTLRNQFDAHTHPYLPLTGGTVTGDLNVSGTLYADQIKGYSENNTNLTLGTGDNTGYIWITDDMFGKNENGEQSWSIDANTGYATFSGVSQTSDQRLKENIHDVDKSFTEKYWATENGLIHEFDWIKSGKHANGMIAQELLNYIPEAVNHNVENDTYSVDYTSATCKMMGAMFLKIKELENEITTLKQEIKKLKNN